MIISTWYKQYMAQMGQFIINHWGLWLAFVVILLLIFINEQMAKKNQANKLSPQETVALINNNEAIIYDIRDNESFKKGHIIDSTRVNADDFAQPKMNANKDKAFILVCANGQQSNELAIKLRAQGFSHAQTLAGGIAGWQQADLPLVKGK